MCSITQHTHTSRFNPPGVLCIIARPIIFLRSFATIFYQVLGERATYLGC